MEFPIRINVYLKERGIASRREADVLIEAGNVLVNGKTAVLGQKIVKHDVVALKDEVQKGLENKRYIAYYKPRGLLTHETPENKQCVVSELKKQGLEGVAPIGRLDKDSEGLLLLSDDGRLTEALIGPESHVEKEYAVTVDKSVSPSILKRLETGVAIEGYRTKKAHARAHPTNKNAFMLTLIEGKKHQIRRMCAALGFQVQSLRRIRVGATELGKLKPGQYRLIRGKERDALLKSLSIKPTTDQ